MIFSKKEKSTFATLFIELYIVSHAHKFEVEYNKVNFETTLNIRSPKITFISITPIKRKQQQIRSKIF